VRLCGFARKLVVAFGVLTLQGQNPPPTAPVIWKGGLLIQGLEFSNPPRFSIEAPNGTVTRTIKVPLNTINRDFASSNFYALTNEGPQRKNPKDGSPTDFTFKIFKRPFHGGDWTEIGAFVNKFNSLCNVACLENGDFLGITSRAIFPVDGGYSPIGILSLDGNGVLAVKHGVTLGMERPMWRDPVEKYGSAQLNYPGFGRSWWNFAPLIRTAEHLVLVLDDIGWLFVFSPKDGALQRVARIFDFIDEAACAQGKTFSFVGLGSQARQDGRILLCTRSADAVEKSYASFGAALPEGIAHDPVKFQAWYSKTKSIRDENLKQFPFLSWWLFDPVTGKVSSENPPQDFPDRVSSAKEMFNWNWRFKGDGNLLYYQTEGASEGKNEKGKKSILGVIGLK